MVADATTATKSDEENDHQEDYLQVKYLTAEISEWVTDLASIDFYHHHPNDNGNSPSPSSSSFPHFPHTVFMLVVGNPGCIGWYVDMLRMVVQGLGRGYAARAVSYAGHGVGKEMIRINEDDKRKREKRRCAHTVDGQVQHKIEWVDLILSEMVSIQRRSSEAATMNQTLSPKQQSQQQKEEVKFVFLTHSIGAHLVQRMMMLRRDLLLRTKMIIHLMPFIRYDPSSWWTKNFLSTAANAPQQVITLLKLLSSIISRLPRGIVDSYLRNIASIQKENDRRLAREIYSQPTYLQNFFELGAEEIRDLPEIHDEAAMRVIAEVCPTSILYCANDHWAEVSHLRAIKEGQRDKRIPTNIHLEFNKDLVHAFIVNPEMIPPVVAFIMRSVKSVMSSKVMGEKSNTILSLKSKL